MKINVRILVKLAKEKNKEIFLFLTFLRYNKVSRIYRGKGHNDNKQRQYIYRVRLGEMMMIRELKKDDFYKCEKLIIEHGQVEVRAVIAGNNPGRIFVDNEEVPTSGIVWLGNHDGFFFIGNEKNDPFNREITSFVDKVIVPEARKYGLNWFEAIGNTSNWNKVIETIFKDRQLGSWNQKVFVLNKENFGTDREPQIDKEYKLMQVTEELYYSTTISNIPFLHRKVLEFWNSPEDFFAKGIGYCIIHNDEIVSLCFSSFVVDGIHAIDIETLIAYQGKNLAQHITYHFVKHCIEKDWVPYWDCMEGNKPSVAVAESIGFTNELDYRGYEFPL